MADPPHAREESKAVSALSLCHRTPWEGSAAALPHSPSALGFRHLERVPEVLLKFLQRLASEIGSLAIQRIQIGE